MFKTFKIPFCVAAFAFILALAGNASANLVTDGNFTSVTYSGTLPLVGASPYGQFGTGYLTVAGWTTTGYNFVYTPGSGDAGTQASGASSSTVKEAPGEATVGGYGNTYMWGSNNGGTVTLPATDPAGGNYLALDGAYEVGKVSQTINGLTIGQVYTLTFYFAGAQQEGYSGTTTDALSVTLGGSTQSTGTINVTSNGFTDWTKQSMNFTATGTSEVLSFLAVGTPTGEPPFALLGGVNLQIVPDFSNWLVFIAFGAACIIFKVLRDRRRRLRAVEFEEGDAFLPVSDLLPAAAQVALFAGKTAPPGSA